MSGVSVQTLRGPMQGSQQRYMPGQSAYGNSHLTRNTLYGRSSPQRVSQHNDSSAVLNRTQQPRQSPARRSAVQEPQQLYDSHHSLPNPARGPGGTPRLATPTRDPPRYLQSSAFCTHGPCDKPSAPLSECLSFCVVQVWALRFLEHSKPSANDRDGDGDGDAAQPRQGRHHAVRRPLNAPSRIPSPGIAGRGTNFRSRGRLPLLFCSRGGPPPPSLTGSAPVRRGGTSCRRGLPPTGLAVRVRAPAPGERPRRCAAAIVLQQRLAHCWRRLACTDARSHTRPCRTTPRLK